MTELNVINGSLITPALLSKSGIPEPQVDQIDLRAKNQREGWVIHQSKFQFGNARATISGIIDPTDLMLKEVPEQPLPLSQQLVNFHNKASAIKDSLSQIEGLEARIRFDASRKGPKSATAVITALGGQWQDKAAAEEVLVEIQASLGSTASLSAHVGSIRAPHNTFAEDLELSAAWSQIPTTENWQPSHAHLTIGSGGQESDFASNLSFAFHPLDRETWRTKGYFQIADSSWKIHSVANPNDKTASVGLTGSPTQGLVELGINLAKQVAPKLGKLPLREWLVLPTHPICTFLLNSRGRSNPSRWTPHSRPTG